MENIDSYICLIIGMLILIFRKQYIKLIIRYNIWRSNKKLKWQIKDWESTISPYINLLVLFGGVVFFLVGLLTLLGIIEFRK